VLVLSLAGGCARRALTKGELYPFRDLGYRGIGEEESESQLTNSSESCKLRKRTRGSIILQILVGNRKSQSDLREYKTIL
jgi:hypothetical protein